MSHRAAILNAGSGAWAFEELAARLSRVLGVPVSESPADLVYLLGWDEPEPPPCRTFIPWDSIVLASDKRLQARVFQEHGVATPRTYLVETSVEVQRLVQAEPGTGWVLKYPTGCGAAGHRLLGPDVPMPDGWPRPFVVQEFIRLKSPEVYRLYAAGGETFGWNVRRFLSAAAPSPWAPHARGHPLH